MNTKCPRYAAQTLPQAKPGRFEFLKTNYGKILEESCTLFTLYTFKLSDLINNLNTILKVLYRGAANGLVFQWEFLQVLELPNKLISGSFAAEVRSPRTHYVL